MKLLFTSLVMVLSATSAFARTSLNCAVKENNDQYLRVELVYDIDQLPANVPELSPIVRSINLMSSTGTENIYGPGVRGVKIDVFSCGLGDDNQFETDTGLIRLSAICNLPQPTSFGKAFFNSTLSTTKDGSVEIDVTGAADRVIAVSACQ